MTKPTVAGLYSAADVARIFGLTDSRVRYWAQTGFINPSGKGPGGRPKYTFADLVTIRAAKELLDQGVPLQRVRKNLGALRQALPQMDQPLTRLRVQSDGDDLVVSCDEGEFEPVSGQLVLNFELDAVEQQAAQILELKRSQEPEPAPVATPVGEIRTSATGEHGAAAPGTAQGWFLRGCTLDNMESREDEALAAYEQALELDPGLAAAVTNMGNLHYRQGRCEEALVCYQRACAMDPIQPEAHYNLANLLEEEGALDEAIDEYRQVLRLAEGFRDAHFNLALALERVGGRNQAILHWERYLELSGGQELDEEDAEWVGLAQQHLERLKKEEG